MTDDDAYKGWDPYETSHKRDFIYRSISTTSPAVRPQTSAKIFRHSRDPVGSTAYSEDFSFKPVSKTTSIRSATASGHRRNNPHPSRAFMIWRCSANQMKHVADGSLTEQEVQKALSAQFRSTYRLDYLGLPQGLMKNHTAPSPSHGGPADHYDTQTEMRHSYCKPVLRAELLGNNSRYGCNKLHGVAVRGIVPTVIQSHLRSQGYSTTYKQYFGSQHTDFPSALSSVQPEMFLHICKHLTRQKEEVKTSNYSSHEWRGRSSERCLQAPPTLERTSAWAGPL